MSPLSDNDAEWLAIRKREALEIDPETAEADWEYGAVLYRYGLYPDLDGELNQTGRVYFARRPGSNIWVCFDDLPDKVRDRLWEQGTPPAGQRLAVVSN